MRSSTGGFSSSFLSVAVLAGGILHSASCRGVPFREIHQFEAMTQMSPVITGLYANDTADAQVVVHDINGVASWTWSVENAKTQTMPADLLSCIEQDTAVPEAKWTNGGSSIITIYNFAALMINYAPGDPSDKQITFGVCLNWDNMTNTHSLELVPDGKLAIATTSPYEDGNIKIFDVAAGLQPNVNPIQELSLLPAVHGLVWDATASLLWAVGSDNDPEGTDPSSSALHAYQYTAGSFQEQPMYNFNISDATLLTTEWNNTEYSNWWDGGHDLAAIPNKRQLLISTDMDLHAFDIDSQTFQSGSVVADKYLPGFMPVDSRVGSDGQSLPRSDIKSLSIDANHNALYVQATWQDVTSYQINRLGNRVIQPTVTYPQQLYRSRWFADTAGWPKATLPKQ